MATISYIPAPHERAYYEALFRAADVQRTGNIGGGPAVQFFSRSKLPIDVLKNIWTVADQPSTSSLDLKKFAVAIRLIQLTQNGKKGEGSNLAVAEGVVLRPAMFEGVSGVTVQLPPQPGQQQQQQAPPQQQPPQQQPPQQQQQQQQPPQQQQQPPPQQQQPPPQQQRQQQNQPPPSPAGQRPSIQQQQMQQQAPPPTPSRQGMPPPTPGGSRALVGQDPYAMTPQERARYESLFPQYAKPDGFIYGKEAVELFMKSGVDQRALRDIWNMVDRPIDNRLDALEFAMAMHLIVCISKKGLPHPTAGLPSSLKALKAAVPATPSGQQRPSVQAPTPGQQAAPGAMPAPAAASASSMPSPTPHRQSFQPQAPPQGQQYGAPQPDAPPAAMPQSTSFEQPQPTGSLSPTRQVPPVVATSGMSISDAFEGLSTTSGDVHQQPSSLPAYVPEQRRESRDYAATPAVPEEYTTELPPQQPPTPAPAPVPVPVPQLDAARSMGSSYDMADSNGELVKLKTVLQKLQAENISLKAQLGTMTEEEKDVQKEIGATVAEISQLSTELAGLRGEVLAAKSRLLEASAQLKAAREKKGTLTEQVAEAKSTKDAINEAYSAVENTAASAHHEEHHAVEQQKNQAVRQSDLFESNLFGGGGGAPPASIPAPAPQQQHMYPPPIQHSMSHDTSDSRQLSAAPGSVASGSFPNQSAPPMQLPPPQAVNKSIPIVQTVSSEDEQEVDMSAPAASSNAEELFTNEFEPPAPAPGIGEPQNPPQPDMGMPPPQQFGQPPPPQQYQTQQYEPQPPPPEVAQSQPSRPNALAGHNRQSSGFAADFVMGGAAIPLSEGPESAVSPAARTYSDSSAYGYDDDDEYQNVEELKKKAESARETAGDAEAAHRKLVNEANELRQDADKSEAMSRSLRAAAEEKKKGTFGGGKKKKLVKEAEKAAADAAEIKKRFLAVQGQANDAQAVAMETKREADRLREEAEKAEYEMAAKASIKEQEKEQAAQAQAPAPPPAPTPSAPAANGYGQQYPPQQGYGYGQPPAPQGQQYPPPQQSNGYGPPPGQYPPPQEAYGYGQPPPMYGGAPPAAEMGYGGGFAAGVMGGGGEKGFDLPSPNQMTQPAGDYANPFDN